MEADPKDVHRWREQLERDAVGEQGDRALPATIPQCRSTTTAG
jgi:hypothetical protein